MLCQRGLCNHKHLSGSPPDTSHLLLSSTWRSHHLLSLSQLVTLQIWAGSPNMGVLTGARLQAEDLAVVMIPAVQSVLITLDWWEVQPLFRLPGEVPVCQNLPVAELAALMPFLRRAGCASSPECGRNQIHLGRRMGICSASPYCVSLPRKKQKRIVTCRTTERRSMGKGTLLLSHVSC